MSMKFVAVIGFAALIAFTATAASANTNAANSAHVETHTERNHASFYSRSRGFSRHNHRLRFVPYRGHRNVAPHIRRIRHALLRAQLGVLAVQIRRIRYAHYHGPRVRLQMRNGRYRVIAPRPQIRRIVQYYPRGHWRNHRLLNRRSG